MLLVRCRRADAVSGQKSVAASRWGRSGDSALNGGTGEARVAMSLAQPLLPIASDEESDEEHTGETLLCHACHAALPSVSAIACGKCGAVVPGGMQFDADSSLYAAPAGAVEGSDTERSRTLARAEEEATLQELDRREREAAANMRANGASVRLVLEAEQSRSADSALEVGGAPAAQQGGGGRKSRVVFEGQTEEAPAAQ